MLFNQSRIARDNLVNNDDATIYNNDENRDISKLFRLRRPWLFLKTMKKPWNLWVFPLSYV